MHIPENIQENKLLFLLPFSDVTIHICHFNLKVIARLLVHYNLKRLVARPYQSRRSRGFKGALTPPTPTVPKKNKTKKKNKKKKTESSVKEEFLQPLPPLEVTSLSPAPTCKFFAIPGPYTKLLCGKRSVYCYKHQCRKRFVWRVKTMVAHAAGGILREMAKLILEDSTLILAVSLSNRTSRGQRYHQLHRLERLWLFLSLTMWASVKSKSVASWSLENFCRYKWSATNIISRCFSGTDLVLREFEKLSLVSFTIEELLFDRVSVGMRKKSWTAWRRNKPQWN